MPQIARESLLSLEAYARARTELRARAIDHKRRRTVHIGEHLTLQFEDELTDRKSTRLNSSHIQKSRMPSSA